MSPGVPYLESGESIVLTTDRVRVDTAVCEALMSTRRLILFNSSDARSEPRVYSLDMIESVRSGRAATGEPVVILLSGDREETGRQIILMFLQNPLENRIPERDLWLKSFIELSVTTRKQAAPTPSPAAGGPAGMRPSVRRWVAPEIIRPKTENFPAPEPVQTPDIHLDAIQDPRPAEIHSEEQASRRSLENTRVPTHTPDEGMPIPSGDMAIRRGLPANVTGTGASGRGADEPSPLSLSILAATRSLISERAREELALPPRPVRIRTTSSLPDLPPPSSETAGTPSRDDVVIIPDTMGPVTPEKEPRSAPEEPILGTVDREDQVSSLPEPPAAAPPSPVTAGEDRVMVLPQPSPAMKRPGAPAPSPGDYVPILTAGGVLLGLLLIVSVFILLSGPGAIPDTPEVPVLPTPLATHSPTPSPAVSPVTTTIQEKGVVIRISSVADYSGQAGDPGDLQPVTGPGTKIVRVREGISPVRVVVSKMDNTGSTLTAEILRDGQTIASRSTTVPMGEIDLLIDPLTGKPPGYPGETPAANTSGSKSSRLEYL